MKQIDKHKVKVIEPVANAITFIAEETKLAGILHRGVIVLRGHDVYLALAKKAALEQGKAEVIPQIDILLRDAPNLRRDAEEISQDDFEVVNRHAFISIWAALEGAIEDTIAFLLRHSSDPISELAGLDVKYKPSTFDDSEKSVMLQVRKIEQSARKRHGSNWGSAYRWVFSKFGVHIHKPRVNEAVLAEANAVRNCILHNTGVVDSRAAQVPSLATLNGKKVRISKSKYLEYYDAVGNFLTGLLAAEVASAFVRE